MCIVGGGGDSTLKFCNNSTHIWLNKESINTSFNLLQISPNILTLCPDTVTLYLKG